MKGKRVKAVGRSIPREILSQNHLLNELQKSLTDLNSPYLFIHNSYGALTKLTVYS